MRKLLCGTTVGIGLGLVSFAARAEQLEEIQAIIGEAGLYVVILVAILVSVYVYFVRSRDERAAPLNRLFGPSETVHSVGPDTLVMECVRAMTTKKIGALIVIEGERLVGIFTERDALNRVLAAGLDPRVTRVSEVMTKEPYCVAPTMTIDAAMQLVTERRFRHLPIVQDGKVLAVVSSGDLTHWLVKDQVQEVQALVDLVARS